MLLEEIGKMEGRKNDFTIRNSYGQLLIELSSNIGAELTSIAMREKVQK